MYAILPDVCTDTSADRCSVRGIVCPAMCGLCTSDALMLVSLLIIRRPYPNIPLWSSCAQDRCEDAVHPPMLQGLIQCSTSDMCVCAGLPLPLNFIVQRARILLW
jgi:hypothetical protein